jgi:hypothetical protein
MANDFSRVRADYAFFEEHSTEAEADLRAYEPHVQSISGLHQAVRILDYGCRDGRFSKYFLSAIILPADRAVHLLLFAAYLMLVFQG